MEKIRILVVEDEAVTAMDIKNNLHKFGYTVPAIESSGEEAVITAEKLKPNLILMDIILKGKMDGIEAAQKISEQLHIPIIFMTAHGDIKTFNRAKPSMPYGYLTKPFEVSDLRIAVDLALFKHQMETKSEAEKNRLKNEFLATMSHEMRTSLNGIIGFSELLYNGKLGQLSPEHKEFMEDILSSSYHLMQIVDDILDLTKIEYRKMKFYPKPINLNLLLNEVLNSLRMLLENKQITLDVKIDPTVVYIIIDPEKLKQVLYNYISNAIKFSADSGKIEINVHPEKNDQFCIEVKDYGIGISKENITNLFTMFQQLDSTVSKNYPGVGVGLALSRRIVEAQGGSIGVKSELGEGSTFFVTLPLVSWQHVKDTQLEHEDHSEG